MDLNNKHTKTIRLRKVPKKVRISCIKVAQFDRAHLLVGYEDGFVRIRCLDDPSMIVFNYDFKQEVVYINFATGSYCLLLVVLIDGSIKLVNAPRDPMMDGFYLAEKAKEQELRPA